MKERVVSGMRPTGPLHIGHYHGVIQNWITLQKTYDCFLFVADWHALTTDYADTSHIKKWSREMVIDWLATGIDPKKAVIFIQSQVPEHAELHLLFSMITPVGWLNRVPSYKEMKDELKDKDLSTYGFLGYPLLQTADIVIYRASRVPVGEDQVAHVELTREIVRRFHSLYKKEVFLEPKPLLTPSSKVPGLDRRKMSKSYNNAIFLSDDAAALEKKILPAPTDPARVKRTDRGNPDNCVIGDYHKIYSDKETLNWSRDGCRTAAIGCVDCKRKLLESMSVYWSSAREARVQWEKRADVVDDIIAEGCKKARQSAGETMQQVREAVQI